jgi:ribonuclease III
MLEEFTAQLKKIGINADKLSLYQTAFTHRSFLNESKHTIESNERLEFLGDAILSFIVSVFLYGRRKNDAEGDLTNLRSFIVRTESLAKAAIKLNLGTYLRMSKGEELSNGRENPQLLANTFEAVLGAIYLDQGLESAKNFVDTTLLPLFEKEVVSGPPKDAKSQLQEIAQNITKTSPRYKILDTTGPDHAKVFTVGVYLGNREIGRGEGSNKQFAEEEAAKVGLVHIMKKRS